MNEGEGMSDDRQMHVYEETARRRHEAYMARDDVTTYADEHEGGQLRIAVAGEQVPLLGLPDSAIPTSDEPQAVDEMNHYTQEG